MPKEPNLERGAGNWDFLETIPSCNRIRSVDIRMAWQMAVAEDEPGSGMGEFLFDCSIQWNGSGSGEKSKMAALARPLARREGLGIQMR